VLLGPAQRQIEFGQSRRCELDRLPALQDGFESFVVPITAAIAAVLVIAACGCRKSHPGWRRCRDGHPRFEMTDLLKLLGGLLLGLFRSRAAREAESAFKRAGKN
jgi:hypothetical protein